MSRRLLPIVGTLFALLSLTAGCSSVDRTQSRRALYVDQHPELSDRLADSILSQRIAVGMTTEMVEVSWGKPSRVEPVDDEELNTRWIYGNFFVGGTMTNLYFDADDVLVKYEVQHRNSGPNTGSVASDPEAITGPSTNGNGELSKGPGGNP